MHDVKPHPNGTIVGTHPEPIPQSGFVASSDATRRPSEPQPAFATSAIFENAPHWFYTLDASGNFLDLNPSALKSLGYSRDEARSLTWEQITIPPSRGVARSLLEKTFAAGKTAPYELAFNTKSAHVVHVEVTLWTVPSADGATIVQGMARDISNFREQQAKAEFQQNLVHALLENSPDAIYFKDLQSRFIEFSNAMCAKYQLTRDQIMGTTDFDHHQTAHASRAFADEQEIICTGEPIVGKVEREGEKDGSESWVLTAKMPFRNSAGEIIGTFGISKDISKIKAAEAKLEQVHKQLLAASHQAGRAEVATSVLHNVGNVLNSVNVSSLLVAQKIRNSKIGSLGKMASLLQEQNGHLTEFVANDPRGKQLPEYLSGLAARLANEQRDVLTELDDMNKNVEHIKEIVAMQQSYARISGVAESAGVIDLVEDAIRMNVGAMERHSVQLVREYSSEPVIMVEKHKVLQILVNLIRNAKYALDDGSPKQKLMTLKVGTNAGGLAIIQVMDNGIGIPQENLTRIFAHGFTTRKDGHGFGLHSGALAAKELGGSLTVESAGIGHGATFTLELPLQPKEKAGA